MCDVVITDNLVDACKVSEHGVGDDIGGIGPLALIREIALDDAPVALANIVSWRKVARLAMNARLAGKSGEAPNAHRYLAHRFRQARVGAHLR